MHPCTATVSTAVVILDTLLTNCMHAYAMHTHAQQAADLDVVNEAEHLSFIVSTANVLAVNYGVVPPPEQELLPLDHPQRNKDAIAKVSAVCRAISLLLQLSCAFCVNCYAT
jgi:hypothetical protein